MPPPLDPLLDPLVFVNIYGKWMSASSGVGEYHQLVVPIEKRSDLIRQCHSESTGGHLRIAKTSNQVGHTGTGGTIRCRG